MVYILKERENVDMCLCRRCVIKLIHYNLEHMHTTVRHL